MIWLYDLAQAYKEIQVFIQRFLKKLWKEVKRKFEGYNKEIEGKKGKYKEFFFDKVGKL